MPDPLNKDTPSATAAAGRQRAAAPGCFRVAGITCGVLFCLFGVLFLALFVAVRPQLGPVVTGWRNFLVECPARLEGDRGLQGALERYRIRNGEYPERLVDLYPAYVSHRSIFHCPADPSPPDTVSYLYRRPLPDASSDKIVLECDHHDLPGAHIRILVPIEGALRQDMKPVPVRPEP